MFIIFIISNRFLKIIIIFYYIKLNLNPTDCSEKNTRRYIEVNQSIIKHFWKINKCIVVNSSGKRSVIIENLHKIMT